MTELHNYDTETPCLKDGRSMRAGMPLEMLSSDEARNLTDAIKSATEYLWTLLLEAYERQAWKALGYESWRSWATAEFEVSQSRAYQMLQQAQVTLALAEAAGDSTMVEITRRDAETIAPHIGEAAEDVRELVDEGMEPREAVTAVIEKYARPHVANNSGENEWYTPPVYVEAARDVLGGFDLDPASSDVANEVIQADTYYTMADDGLSREWVGRLWMNPPYAADLIGKFTDKMAESYDAGGVTEAIVLVNNATETRWFQRLARSARAICFPERRVRFLGVDGEQGAPLQGQAFIYLGADAEAFTQQFAAFGLIVEVRSV